MGRVLGPPQVRRIETAGGREKMKKTSDGWFVYEIDKMSLRDWTPVHEHLADDPFVMSRKLGFLGMAIKRFSGVFPEKVLGDDLEAWVHSIPQFRWDLVCLRFGPFDGAFIVSPVEMPWLVESK